MSNLGGGLHVKDDDLRYSGDQLLFMLGAELRGQLTELMFASQMTDSLQVQLQMQEALRTIDSLLLYRRLDRAQSQLEFGPVHVGAILTSVHEEMLNSTTSRMYDVEIVVQPGITTIHTDPEAFRAGMAALWQAVLRMSIKPSPLQWRVFKVRGGIRVSVTNYGLDISKMSLTETSERAGYSRQPIQGATRAATDLITAKGIFALLGGNMRKVRIDMHHGFGVTIPKSAQLALL